MFGWLFGTKLKKPNYTVSGPQIVEDDIIRGTFEYQCRVSCSSLKSDYHFTVTVHDNKTRPVVRCMCGRKVTLMDAPIVTERTIGDRVHKSRRGDMMRIDCGDGHSVHMGKTFRYELDK